MAPKLILMKRSPRGKKSPAKKEEEKPSRTPTPHSSRTATPRTATPNASKCIFCNKACALCEDVLNCKYFYWGTLAAGILFSLLTIIYLPVYCSSERCKSIWIKSLECPENANCSLFSFKCQDGYVEVKGHPGKCLSSEAEEYKAYNISGEIRRILKEECKDNQTIECLLGQKQENEKIIELAINYTNAFIYTEKNKIQPRPYCITVSPVIVCLICAFIFLITFGILTVRRNNSII